MKLSVPFFQRLTQSSVKISFTFIFTESFDTYISLLHFGHFGARKATEWQNLFLTQNLYIRLQDVYHKLLKKDEICNKHKEVRAYCVCG